MSEIKIFNHPTFGDIRTTGTAEMPLFCLIDLCRVLDLIPSKVSQRLTKDVLSKYPLETAGGKQMTNFVNEDGLYDVILDSRKPEAKMFRKWVTSEVLPSIRKHGAYMTEQVMQKALNDPDFIIQLATNLKNEQRARQEAEERAALLRVENENKDKEIAENKPKVVFADAIVGSKSTILIGQLAKVLTQNGYPIGQNRLFKWLRDNHYLGSWGSYYNIPYQVYVEQGLFEVKTTTHSEGEQMVSSYTTKVTGKGQQYFINLFMKLKEEEKVMA